MRPARTGPATGADGRKLRRNRRRRIIERTFAWLGWCRRLLIRRGGLRQIPGHEDRLRNPHKRLTTPDDVARCIIALCHPATYWMTGNTNCTWTAEKTS